jgi:hypothetical protein
VSLVLLGVSLACGLGAEGLGLLLAAVIHGDGAELVHGVGTHRARHHHILIEIPHGAADVTA